MVTRLKPDTAKKPLLSRYGPALFLAGWLALMAFGAFELFGGRGPSHQIRANGKVHEELAVTEAGSLGGEREALLVAATRRYVKEHPEAPAAMVEGKELAPADYLNERLSEQQAHFRVRSVKGMRAELYDVS